MTIDASPTIDALTAAIDSTHMSFAIIDGGLTNASGVASARGLPKALANPRPEIVDARAQLAKLKTASDTYLSKLTAWLASYRDSFLLLDRHARWVLSLTTTSPTAIAFSSDQPTHDLLAARAATAAASGADAVALTELARYRSTFDVSWASQSTIADAVAALTDAISSAQQTISYLAWAKANP
ncbi:hypothetical protein AKJ09_08327 [Labilithrix luteola]|uniref:Uncharacterized protein n=1 Tax=Labilithrix luteola TaxID=1391654 RepID=A0A0K1Q7F6_9BACT|nr:hypothetical protein [Labilithrix luteola]AKV01664.1 hypothetical protein AKJ09_08327 [Labilithrix luteola]